MKTNLKEMRKAAGWSNADDFARSVGIPPKTYRNYEQGVRTMGLDVACEICNALDCTLNDITEQEVKYALVEFDGKDVDAYEPDEAELVSMYRSMQPEHRELLMENARAFAALSEKNAEDVGQTVRVGTLDALI